MNMRCAKNARNMLIATIAGWPIAQGSPGCYRGPIQIGPYSAWFTRVQHRADHGPPLRHPDRYGSPDGNPAHIHVSPGKTWHTIRRGRPRSTRRVNPENHAGVYRSQPAPRCVSSGFKLGGGYALLVKESCTPHILTREARQRGDEPPAVVMRTRRVPSAVR